MFIDARERDEQGLVMGHGTTILKPRVLIVEDELLQARLVATMLEHWNLEVIGIASDGAKALALVEAIMPDLLLLDIGLPEVDGIQVAKDILGKRSLPIVVITGQTSARRREELTSIGVSQCVIKPFTGDELRAALRNACRGRL